MGVVWLVANPSVAGAQEADAAALASATQGVLDNLWVFIAGILVFFMQAGFAFVEAGMTRAKNVANIMAKNMADFCVGVAMFFLVGFMFAFGGDGSFIGFDLDYVGLSGLDLFPDPVAGELTPATTFFFQAVFAATAVTIASGAMAERTKFTSYLVFAAAMTAFIYPVVVHWTWGGGWIADLTIGDAVYSDFAGSSVVHLTGACAALMGALVLGPRLGKYSADGTPRALPGHSMPFAIIGVFILTFGWFGFNAGSELLADTFVMFVGLNTAVAAAFGGIAAAAAIWAKTGKMDVGMTGNGILAGLVSITAPVGSVDPWAAAVIGALGGTIVVFGVLAIERAGVDDPVGAIAVHGLCGIWGTLSIGLFATHDDAFLGRSDAGLLYGGGVDQLAVQLVLVVAVMAWTLTTTGVLFKALDAAVGIRVSEEEEYNGLDVMEHGAPGYATSSPAGPGRGGVATAEAHTVVAGTEAPSPALG